jgi:hypothetical protein
LDYQTPESVIPVNKDALRKRFEPVGVLRGGELFLSPQRAEQLIDEAGRGGCAVTGVETFILEPSATRPLLEYTADFSASLTGDWARDAERCNEWAREFIRSLPSDDRLFVSLSIMDGMGTRR